MDTDFRGKVTTFRPTDKGAEIDVSECEPGEVARLLGTFFQQNGFKLEKGDPTSGTYGSGSGMGRIAAGGFAGRRKYDVKVAATNGAGVSASISSAMSGFGGGALGVVKERKQRRQFVDNLRAFVA